MKNDEDLRRHQLEAELIDRKERLVHLTRERANLINAIRTELGLSQAKLAELVGTSQQSIDRIEKGTTSHSRFIEPILNVLFQLTTSDDARDKIAAIREYTIHIHTSEEIVAIRSREMYERDDNTTTTSNIGSEFSPIYAINDGKLSAYKVEEIIRPYKFRNIYDLYGILVPDNKMSPAYLYDDTVLFNPNIPARPGNDVLMRQNTGLGYTFAFMAILNRIEDEHWIVSQHSGATETVHALSEWAAHVAVARFIRV